MWVLRKVVGTNDQDEIIWTKYQVGYYYPTADNDGSLWYLDTVFDDLEEASARVSYLNGGAKPSPGGYRFSFGEARPAFEPPF